MYRASLGAMSVLRLKGSTSVRERNVCSAIYSSHTAERVQNNSLLTKLRYVVFVNHEWYKLPASVAQHSAISPFSDVDWPVVPEVRFLNTTSRRCVFENTKISPGPVLIFGISVKTADRPDAPLANRVVINSFRSSSSFRESSSEE